MSRLTVIGYAPTKVWDKVRVWEIKQGRIRTLFWASVKAQIVNFFQGLMEDDV
jgi:hypothetical protein